MSLPIPADLAAIRIVGVNKHYHIWNSPSARLFYSVLSQAHRTLRYVLERETPALVALARRRDALAANFEALDGINLTVARGESVGIIGRNGSGKSTLLQIIAGTLQPTNGTVEVAGRVAAMLELGSGFNPEFTGRENVYLNATILGLTKKEIDACIDAIVDFADLGMFIDQPVKTYSSGMVVRLGFAVLTQIEPEILIIDEALSVGDFLFQQKCFDFIRRFKAHGGTLLFVSHAMSTVMELCDRAVLLDSGHLAFDGAAKDAVNLYAATAMRSRFQTGSRPLQIVVPEAKSAEAEPPATTSEATALPATPPPPAAVKVTTQWADPLPAVDLAGTGPSEDEPAAEVGSVTSDDASLQFVRLLGPDGAERDWITSEEEVTLLVGIQCARLLHDPHVGFKIRDRLGRVVFETSTLCMRERIGAVAAGQCLVSRFRFGVPLADGEYSVTIGFANGTVGDGAYEEALLFQHGVKIFQVYKNPQSIVWSGVFNLRPRASFEKQEGVSRTAGRVLEKSAHD